MYMPMDCKIVWLLLVWITIIGIRDNAKATFLDISTRFVHLAANCAKIVLLSAWIHGVSNLSVMSLTKGRPRLYIKGLKAEPTEIRKRQELYIYLIKSWGSKALPSTVTHSFNFLSNKAVPQRIYTPQYDYQNFFSLANGVYLIAVSK